MTKANDMIQLQQQVAQMQKQLQANNAYKHSAIHKRMEKEAEKWFDEKVAEKETVLQQQKFIKETIANMMLGKPEHRDVSTIKTVNGVLMRVATDDQANVVKVEPIKSFGELDYAERSQLMTENKKLYTRLKHDVYKPEMNDFHIDVMVTDGIKYDEWSILADTPQKPSLEGLSMDDSSKVLSDYRTATEAHTTRLTTYQTDKTAYETGVMNNDLRECESKIESINRELNGE
ncbi:hypothetical protein P4646_25935 [Peribacillus simplex]|uniref:hypothetical protein n=1 Tax=Peribacillus simplex TaxID=1478 RepID=UPI002E1F404E|nr:hypothetical protein [Peribacillus simplex]MED4092854.1 hypothetical protein [Peribacillus simplex]